MATNERLPEVAEQLRPLPGWSPPPLRQPDDPLPPVDPPADQPPAPAPGRRLRLGRVDPSPVPSTRPAAAAAAPPMPPPGTGSTSEPDDKPGRAGRRWLPQWKPSGDPEATGEILAGLILAAAGLLAWRVARRGRQLRIPTDDQAAGIGEPLGRIATRHLPMGALNPDVKDASAAARGIVEYLRAGPLLGPLPAVTVTQGAPQ